MDEPNLQHEDLLIKLRAQLNDEKIKLWEPPYIATDESVNQSLKDLAAKYSTTLAEDADTVLSALCELQTHSLDRSKANAQYKETGFATFRVKATNPGKKIQVFKIKMKLDVMGSDLISAIASEVGVEDTRVKLIFNGKVVKPSPSLEEQGLKHGLQIMALVMIETAEKAREEDGMYMEMKQTRDDATLLSECVEELADDEEYMKLEDQSGKTVNLPPAEKRSLLVGLALHEKGRARAKEHQYPLALVLLLEADRLLSECRSAILKTVDNWAVLQLDISWCYLCLQSLGSAGDAAARLASAEQAFVASYGRDAARSAANERVLFMRLYLLQGIVAYHQNRRSEARRLLDQAEVAINALAVDESAVTALMELGWSASAARAGLRACAGELTLAHNYLADKQARRHDHRTRHTQERQQRLLGTCADGSPVSQQLVTALTEMGHCRRQATRALRLTNNHAADAVRILQEQPELVQDSDTSDDITTGESSDSSTSLVAPDERLVTELVGMGYREEAARAALVQARNHVSGAVDALASMPPITAERLAAAVATVAAAGPSTSAASTPAARNHAKLLKKVKARARREAALARLSAAIRPDGDEYLDTCLTEEQYYLAQYKSLL